MLRSIVGLLDLARDLPHALPRRPLPGAAGDAEDVRASRPGAPAHDLWPSRPLRPLRRPTPPVFGRLTYPLRARQLRPGDGSSATVTGSRPSRSTTASRVGYALVEEPRPGRFDAGRRRRARHPVRAGARRAPARRGRHARRTGAGHARLVVGEARAGRTVVLAGDTAPRERRRARRRARTSSSTRRRSPRRSATARGDPPLDRGAGSGGRARRPRRAARADASLEPLLRPGGRRGGPRDVPGDRRAQGLRRDRGSVPGTGWAGARKGGARPARAVVSSEP